MPVRTACVASLLVLAACYPERDRGFIEVTGYVPTAGATITIWSEDGSDQGTLSADDGSFTFRGVKPPYDILYASDTWRSLRLGSTAAHQNFGVILRGGTISERSFVHVSVTGRDPASTYAFWGIDCGRDEQTSGPVSLFTDIFPSFFVDEPTTCPAQALAFSRTGDSYSGYASGDVEIMPRQEGFYTLDATEPVPSQLAHFDVTNPNPTTTRVGTGLAWAFGQYSTAVAVLRDGDLTLTDLAIPESSDLHLAAFFGSAGSDDAKAGFAYAYRALTPDQTDFDVAVPNAEIMIAPATDGAHLTARDAISIEPRDGVVYQLLFDTGEVTLMQPTISFAELEDRGMDFELGVRQHLQVAARTGTSVDDDTSENALVRLPTAVRILSGSRSFFVD